MTAAPDATSAPADVAPAPAPAPMPVPVPSVATTVATTPPASAAPAAVAPDPLAQPAISDAERRALAAIPLPRLPNLVREAAPTELAAVTPAPAAAGIPPRIVAPGESLSAPPLDAAGNPLPVEPKIETGSVASELRRASERTGLGDAELTRIRSIEQQIAAGDSSGALRALAALNTEFDNAASSHVVARGEGLWQIASQPETYGNALLWPLIWRANAGALKDPTRVLRGQKLRIPRFPSLSAVAEALDYARRNPLDRR
ncbi:LysM peptidoglycan-binding domain-containing protein [Nevskia sp.]|uniref:LysM peptidoglycan-binding domain-containing protein n=1 Tax=Nevskia sp. TaxID=1929292 RepID=UPI0025DF55AC|nr:LysM peptidoglycan-binding domain-containing protein [Nevskia sp.]